MTIEVKQLTINSSVITDEEKCGEDNETKGKAKNSADPYLNADDIKEDVIAECRRLIRSSLESLRER